VLVTGANGAGKTNLLESLHVATQGFSPRTRSDAQLIRRGSTAARIDLKGQRASVPVTVSLSLSVSEPKRARLDGAALRSAEQLRTELATLVFTPDRLVVVKGGPAARRAYVDRSLGRLYPARAHLPVDYGAALGQRNAALRRVSLGLSEQDVLSPWTAQVADLGAMLTAARRDVLDLLQPGFAERAAELGLPDASLGYDAEPLSIGVLEARLAKDVERGATGAGPHLDEIAIRGGDRDLRTFGSQGEQRLAVLALLLAEAELVGSRRRVPPLLLLDDALSELDERRRRILSERIGTVGQTIVTATGAEALPLAPAQLLRVTPGRVEPA
jgi:DNA replication and repair protein RecF